MTDPYADDWVTPEQRAFDAGAASRDAEVAALKTEINTWKNEACLANAHLSLDHLLDKNTALNARIAELTKALALSCTDCECIHHEKKHQHKSGEPCPVEKIIKEALR